VPYVFYKAQNQEMKGIEYIEYPFDPGLFFSIAQFSVVEID
jgi:hypothetical protein